jgi:hypothetical protein
MKKTFIIIALALPFFFACGGSKENNEEQEKVYELTELLSEVETLVDSTVLVEGTVTHVCMHSGMKLFLEGSTPEESMKIVSESEKFDTSLVGQVVIVEGVVEEFRVDQAYVDSLRLEILAEIESDSIDKLDGTEEEHHHQGEMMSDDSAPIDHHSDHIKQVEDFQQQIDESEKGYISFYSIKAKSVNIKEEEKEEETE